MVMKQMTRQHINRRNGGMAKIMAIRQYLNGGKSSAKCGDGVENSMAAYSSNNVAGSSMTPLNGGKAAISINRRHVYVAA